jgi:hypothetical protein
VSGEVPTPGAETAVDATNAPLRDGSDSDGRTALRDELVGLLCADVLTAWSIPTDGHAKALADKILAAGFRRLVEDDDTVDRVARALWVDHLAGLPKLLQPIDDAEREEFWGHVVGSGHFHTQARAAVRALREDT